MRQRFLLAALAVLTLASGCERQSATAPSPSGTAGVSATGSPQSAVVLVEVTAGFTGTSNNYVGQSVTIEQRGAFNNIRFNWFDPAGQPVAFGTLYLLDREYLGVPPALSPSTPGFVAASDGIVDGQYAFAPGVVLKGGERYWFYTDTRGAFVSSFSDSTYAGGDMYVTGMPDLPFRKALASGMVPPPPGTFIDANFRLEAR